jgi:hypothetical protein
VSGFFTTGRFSRTRIIRVLGERLAGIIVTFQHHFHRLPTLRKIRKSSQFGNILLLSILAPFAHLAATVCHPRIPQHPWIKADRRALHSDFTGFTCCNPLDSASAARKE